MVGGFLMAHPSLTALATGALGLGHYSWIAALVFACYVVGLTLQFFSATFYGVLSIALGAIAFRKGGVLRDNLWWSQRPLWRRVATKLLGQGLIPQASAPSPAPVPNPFSCGLA